MENNSGLVFKEYSDYLAPLLLDCMNSQMCWAMNNSNDKTTHAVFDRKILLGQEC